MNTGALKVLKDANGAFERAAKRLDRALRRQASRMTEDVDAQDDLVQEGLIALWELDASRYCLSDKEDRNFLLKAVVNRMRDVWRRSRGKGAARDR